MHESELPSSDRTPLLRRLARAEKHRAEGRRGHRLGWRLGTPIAFIAAGTLLVTSGINAEGTDLRAGRQEDLADLANQETRRVQSLREDVSSLNREIDELTADVDDATLDELQGRLDTLELAAQVAPVTGPGLTVVLDDAPPEIVNSAGESVNEAIVHQDDIQAVANALWAGGAEAMTIQGQRIISTTGIKCIGNTVRLQDVPYSPPYRISAIGPVATMRASLDTNPYIDAYLVAVQQWQLTWEVTEEESLEAPEYDGPLELRYARPVTRVGTGS